MKYLDALRMVVLVAFCVTGSVFTAATQDVPLPLKWKGEGVGLLVLPDDVENIPFTIELHVDEQGDVSGEAYFDKDQGAGIIEKLYYTDPVQGIRQLVLVVVAHEDENPNMFILKGKMIDGRLAFGEVLTKAFEKDGEIERRLELHSKTAVQFYESYMPSSLRNAIDRCKLIGSYHIIGSFTAP